MMSAGAVLRSVRTLSDGPHRLRAGSGAASGDDGNGYGDDNGGSGDGRRGEAGVRHALLITAVGIISALPALVFGLPFFGHDGPTHALWYSDFARQFWDGELYPRWLSGMNGGLGSPALFYYPPVPYYLTAPLKLLFTNDPYGWRQLGISAAAAQIASGLCAYLWLRRIARPSAAALSAALYVLMPYHLGLDLYRRASFAELWSFVWMPLVLHAARGLARGGGPWVAGLAIVYGLLAATHLPVTLIFSPVVVCYALYCAPQGGRAKALGLTLCALLLGVGLAAVYLLPALALQEYVRVEEMSGGFLYYENWFLVTRLKPWGATAGYFWIAFVEAGLCACAYLLVRRGSDERLKREAGFWGAVAAACVLLMLPLSKPVWMIVPALQKIQFPWRFNAVMCVTLAALLALAFSVWREVRPMTGRGLRIFALLLFAFWLPYAAAQAWRAYPATRPHAKDIGDINRRLGQRRDAPEYLPRAVESIDGSHWELQERTLAALLDRVGRTDGEASRAIVLGGAGDTTEASEVGDADRMSDAGAARIEEWGPRRIVLRVSTPREATIQVSQFYYPGWTARAEGVPEELRISASAPDGLIRLFVPAGEHRVVLRLGRLWPERYGLFVSGATLLVLLVLLGYCAWRARSSTGVRR
jgi:hypothetical protein